MQEMSNRARIGILVVSPFIGYLVGGYLGSFVWETFNLADLESMVCTMLGAGFGFLFGMLLGLYIWEESSF